MEQKRYRMVVNCPCFKCEVAAVVNKHHPDGITEDSAAEIFGTLLACSAALVTQTQGERGFILPAMSLSASTGLVEEWRKPQ